jgi:hypothetical protein
MLGSRPSSSQTAHQILTMGFPWKYGPLLRPPPAFGVSSPLFPKMGEKTTSS